MADEKTEEAPEVQEAQEVQTYYLRPNMHHNVIFKGENKRLDKAGDTAELAEQQYTNFKDKFFTAAEYKAYKEQQALATKEVSKEAAKEEGSKPDASTANPGKK